MTDFKIYNQFISYVMSNYSYNCILKELKLITSISMILISPYIYEKNQDFHPLEKMARDC